MSPRLVRLSLGALSIILGGCSARDEARKASMRSTMAAMATSVEGRAHPRPARRGRPVLPGTFGDAFTAREPERKALEASSDAAARCATSEADLQQCAADLAPTRGALETILDLGRAERAGAPAASNVFAPMNAPPIGRSLFATCTHSAAHTVLELQRGNAEEAARLCIQTLEISRDYIAGANLVGGMDVVTCLEELDAPCTRALAALTNAERRDRARKDIQAVAETMPPVGEIAEVEFISFQLGLCGNYLEAAERAQLGPFAKASAEAASEQYRNLPTRERRRFLTLCLDGFEASLLAVKAYREPKGSPARAQLLAEHEKQKVKAIPAMNICPFADEYEAALAKLQALAH